MFKRFIAFFMIFCLSICNLNGFIVFATDEPSNEPSIDIKVLNDNENEIKNGQTAIDTNNQNLKIKFSSKQTIHINKDKAKEIKIIADKDDETYKFDTNIGSDYVELKMKNDKNSKTDSLNPYKLRDSTLYYIHIPEGVSSNLDDTLKNKEQKSYFVTTSVGNFYTNDILKATNPINNDNGIDYNDSQIIYEFVGDIQTDVPLEKFNEYVSVTRSHILTNTSTEIVEDINNYDINIVGNKLIINAKNKLTDMSKYKVSLKEKFVYLKNAENVKIYNGNYNDLTFSTDKLYSYTEPINNQEGVDVNPNIKFYFKYKIDQDKLKEKLKKDPYSIRLVEDNAESLAVNIPIDINVVSDNILSINLQKTDAKYTLRASTVYKVIIKADTINIMDDNKNPYDYTQEKDIYLYFITTKDGDNPVPIKYSSDLNATDDIRDINNTQLKEDGSIYVKFNRDIRKDVRMEDINNSNWFKNGFKLYKVPASSKKEYDAFGVLFDKLFGYIKESPNGEFILPMPIKEEIAIESVEINNDTLIIKPTHKLLALNQYELQINKDYIEDLHGYNMKNSSLFRFWTKKSDVLVNPVWDISSIPAKEIKEKENLPYKAYTLYGVPRYNKNAPIIVNVKGEVIPNTAGVNYKGEGDNSSYSNDYLSNIKFTEMYNAEEIQEIPEKTEEGSPILTKLNRVVKLVLPENLQQDKEIKWDSEDNSIVLIDENGYMKGMRKGQTRIYARDAQTNIIVATAEIKVLDSDLYIDKIDLEYYYENGIKNTKIKLYPNMSLDSGKMYYLNIPNGVFETRAKENLEQLSLEFVTEGEIGDAIGIYNITPNELSTESIQSNDETFINIYGFNFNERIDKIVLRKINPTNEDLNVVINKEDIYFKSVDQIRFAIRGTTKDAILKLGSGEYKFELYFENISTAITFNTNIKLTALSYPVLDSYYPTESGFYDETSLKHFIDDDFTKGKYFIHVKFKDPNGDVKFSGIQKLLNYLEASVKLTETEANLIDYDFLRTIDNKTSLDKEYYINKYLFVRNKDNKTVTLYIPVKQLHKQYKYEVFFAKGLVSYGDSEANQSLEIKWSFSTRGTPSVNDTVVGSLVEDYDTDDPIIIRGEFFNSSNIVVYIGDTKASDVKVKEVEDEDKVKSTYLYIYLPKKRLKPGLYDITISNDSSNEIKMYGAISIVEEGRKVPKEKQFEEKGVSPYIIKSIKDKLRGRTIVSEFVDYTTLSNNDNKIEYKSTSENISVLRYDEDMRSLFDVNFKANKIDGIVYVDSYKAGVYVVVE